MIQYTLDDEAEAAAFLAEHGPVVAQETVITTYDADGQAISRSTTSVEYVALRCAVLEAKLETDTRAVHPKQKEERP